MPTIYLNSQPWTITPIQWIAQFNVTVKYGNSHALHTSDYATLIGPTDLVPTVFRGNPCHPNQSFTVCVSTQERGNEKNVARQLALEVVAGKAQQPTGMAPSLGQIHRQRFI